jgi:hypothetical protein
VLSDEFLTKFFTFRRSTPLSGSGSEGLEDPLGLRSRRIALVIWWLVCCWGGMMCFGWRIALDGLLRCYCCCRSVEMVREGEI